MKHNVTKLNYSEMENLAESGELTLDMIYKYGAYHGSYGGTIHEDMTRTMMSLSYLLGQCDTEKLDEIVPTSY